jgi:hypothetical protein
MEESRKGVAQKKKVKKEGRKPRDVFTDIKTRAVQHP